MKKLMVILAALMLAMGTMAYAGGDQNCGDKASGPAGDSGGGQTSRSRSAAD
jgi:hypothetical protein